MKGKTICFALGLITILISANSLIAEVVADPTYSEIDGVYFSDPSVNCIELKNSEVCEMFKAEEIYSSRDGISYSDCTIECEDMLESNACFSFRDTYPCPGNSDSLVASLSSFEDESQITN